MARSARLSRWSHQVKRTWFSSIKNQDLLSDGHAVGMAKHHLIPIHHIRRLKNRCLWSIFVIFAWTYWFKVYELTSSKCLNLPVQSIWTYRYKASELTGTKRLNLPVHSLITYLVKGSSCTWSESHHLLVLRLITDELGDSGSLEKNGLEAVNERWQAP